MLLTVSQAGAAGNLPSVLIVGDSHTAGPYGAQLDRRFQQKHYKITRVGCVGASNVTFLNGGGLCNRGSVKTGVKGDYRAPRFKALLSETNPDLIVISLGANMYDSLGWTAERRRESARKMAEMIEKQGIKKCFWVGPKYGPNKSFGEAGKVMSDLYAGFGAACEPIDSRKLAEFNWCGEEGDFKPCCCNRNSHYSAVRYGSAGPKRAREWANQVFELFMGKVSQ